MSPEQDNQEIRQLFKDVLDFEEMAIIMYSSIIEMSKDKKLNKLVGAILKDEEKHAKNAREILQILDE